MAFLQQTALTRRSKPLLLACRRGTLPIDFLLHWQATLVEQATAGFHAPYSGPNSLSPWIGRETADTTLYLGARLWSGAELWINPESIRASD